jgi:WD40 repeat protein
VKFFEEEKERIKQEKISEEEKVKKLNEANQELTRKNEELRIVQKLENSENAADTDLLIDLDNVRKYSFVNYKNFSKDGFKLRTSKSIEAIRYINVKKKKTDTLDIRIGNDSIDLSVVGIGWNPSNTPLNCFKIKNFKNVLEITKKENGFLSFTKTMKSTFDKEKHKFNIQDEIDLLHNFLYSLRSVHKGKVVYLEGNHEYRLYRYLMKHPELSSISRINTVSNFLQLKDFNID